MNDGDAIQPRVSHHALLRYYQRIDGVDVERLRKRLARAAAIGIEHGAPAVILGPAKLIIRDTVVTTVLRRQWPTRFDAFGVEIDPDEHRSGRRR